MHIATETNRLPAWRLQQPWQYRNRPEAETIAKATEYACRSGIDTASPLYLAFEKAGLIGCIEDDSDLAEQCKQRLDYSDKCG
uniref:Uncharacterized protein n=1 Tax=Candidatus Kentrum sp. MB TaxID=2138164 RepID=A0A451BAI8_9GAMM|nr:MAG: hypothetical protein BECKMB1821G_GA0114241_100757 [Candidatus Kentron sp. MB]VFK30572.1 MAG: hypothetical protein BECKMB1821I_GA0114274_101639 [Candidatus Kentron sp. MB]VFK75306.1 MAG: hypothetical protein BECKMB1821H_GA0114242_101938 [Candidatus Kentron sp. MB]